MWDPGQYLHFADERSRPFLDLLGRVRAADPGLVADLGCGPGQLTATLADRWPDAEIRGIDSSAEMIEAARQLSAARLPPAARQPPAARRLGLPSAGELPADGQPRSAGVQVRPAGGDGSAGRLSFAVADVRQWRPERPADVIVCNAVLQWVPDHLELLTRWAGLLSEGGWLAFQVPGNFDQPSHVVLRELARSDRWRSLLAEVSLNRQAADPAEYLDLLARSDCEVDTWETTYLHILHGEDPVLDWYKGTGLRPVISALPPGLAAEFVADYGARIREAYPAAPYGTVLPFRRVFVVARRS